MSENPSANEPIREMSWTCIAYLKFAMAGDLESVELLNQLLERHKSIEWNSPGFIADSQEMRRSAVVQPPDLKNLGMWQTILHLMDETAATNAETTTSLLATSHNQLEVLKKMKGFQQAFLDYTLKIVETHYKMRDHLEMLSADVSPYQLPEFPKAPNLQ